MIRPSGQSPRDKPCCMTKTTSPTFKSLTISDHFGLNNNNNNNNNNYNNNNNNYNNNNNNNNLFAIDIYTYN